MKKKIRDVDLVVLSDTHLGTIGARAKELYLYLKSINPGTIVLNGDIVDIWQFNKRSWNRFHTEVVKQLLGFMSKGVNVYYIAGNHDEALRRFIGFKLHGFTISNKLVLERNGKKIWFFHGDVFDVTMQHSRWLTKLGGVGYDILIGLNYLVNKWLSILGREKLSFSKTIKNKVKAKVSQINKFEETVVHIAAKNNYDIVVCGHIHEPCIKDYKINQNKVTYMNSGDWIENMTALEYNEKIWNLHFFEPSQSLNQVSVEPSDYKNSKELFSDLVNEITI